MFANIIKYHKLRKMYTAAALLNEENRQQTLKCIQKPIFRGSNASQLDNKPAAVLIAICLPINTGQPSLLYTRRSIALSRHSAQISFPGGLRDKTDNTDIECALRECEEEIGLSRQRIEVWGAGGLLTNNRDTNITPVVGLVRNFDVHELKLNTHEVTEAFAIPICTLADPNVLRHTQFRRGYSLPVFLVNTHKRIWGLTAFMTYNFFNCFLPQNANWHKFKGKLKYIKPYKLSKSH